MASRKYWLDLFTGVTWKEFLDAGAEVSGFSINRLSRVRKISPGDYLLCYLTGVSRFIGVLEVTSKSYEDDAPIWADSIFPARLKVKPVITLLPEVAVPVKNLRGVLSCFKDLKNPHAWTGRFRGSPMLWSKEDGEAVVEALREAAESPVSRPVDPRALGYRPKALRANKMGSVTVPENDSAVKNHDHSVAVSEHSQIQYLLYQIGCDMGLDVWIARNDQGRVFRGRKEKPRILSELPNVGYDTATARTVELIDVLWLDKNNVVAAFEIECTTSIYSGLLRMADLLAMQPNTNIPLFIVAPDDRREKVFSEINRPVFAALETALSDICKYVPFSALKEKFTKHKEVIRMLKAAEFLDFLSETCEVDESD